MPKPRPATMITVSADTYSLMHQESAQARHRMVEHSLTTRHADGSVSFPIDAETADSIKKVALKGERLDDTLSRLLRRALAKKAN